jgi:hypothetical protein
LPHGWWMNSRSLPSEPDASRYGDPLAHLPQAHGAAPSLSYSRCHFARCWCQPRVVSRMSVHGGHAHSEKSLFAMQKHLASRKTSFLKARPPSARYCW